MEVKILETTGVEPVYFTGSFYNGRHNKRENRENICERKERKENK